MLKMSDPELYAKLAAPTEEQRTAFLDCFQWADDRRNEDTGGKDKGLKTLVQHPYCDVNVLQIVCSYV
jgi:hypothetical protein